MFLPKKIFNLACISTLELLIADELKKIVQAASEKNPRALMFLPSRDIK